MFWVYILENPAGRFYIGHSDNLKQRLPSNPFSGGGTRTPN
jgi:predicted GIY-YIG superfamily endonuclease